MLERRRKPVAKDSTEQDADSKGKDDLRAASEAARRDASRRASELIARLRKL